MDSDLVITEKEVSEETKLKIHYKTATLQKDRADGQIQLWRGFALVGDFEDYYRTSASRMIKADGTPGKLTVAEPTPIGFRNFGKKNEVIPRDQSKKEVEAQGRVKLQEGYYHSQDASASIKPMGCKMFKDEGHRIRYPCIVQPKYDGVRVLWCPLTDSFRTKKGKVVNRDAVSHLTGSEFQMSSVVFYLDGELMLPEKYTFQQTISAVKKKGPLSHLLVFHIFDAVLQEEGYASRIQRVEEEAMPGAPPGWILTPSERVSSKEEVMEAMNRYVSQGFEGVIVRNLTGGYKPRLRSPDLQKLKPMTDEEFILLDMKTGTGRASKAAVFKLQTEAGKIFYANPKMTIKEREKLYKERDNHLGKLVTIQFQGWTDEGKPRFPIAIAIRDYE